MGLETVVRPVVVPNIRPPAAQSAPGADAPDKGIAKINGSNGRFLDLTYSWSATLSQSNPREQKRRVDTFRIYQKDNRDNYVDVEIANKLWMDEGKRTIKRYKFKRGEEADNIELLDTDQMKTNPDYVPSSS
jgi:hypothetical protein